ncbi:hypothetical protein [Sulfolobus spindle-shaped virus]|nr:hypothetical protein [Sulfolobus spindle-shaped virus]
MNPSFFSTPQKLLLVIYEYYEKYKTYPAISEIYSVLNRNTKLWYNWQDFLVENGLIEIKETRSRAGSIKKIVQLTDKGMELAKLTKQYYDDVIKILNEIEVTRS